MKARFVPSRASHLTWVLTALLTCADFCYADSPTLLRWGAAPEVEGGPDLDAPLVTDRPDFTEASSTVGLGVAQLEVGYTYASDDDGTTSTKSHSFPDRRLLIGRQIGRVHRVVCPLPSQRRHCTEPALLQRRFHGAA